MKPTDDYEKDEFKDFYDKEYVVIKEIPTTYCSSLAPHLPQGCETLRLVTVSGPFGYSVTDVKTVLYGLFEQSYTDQAYIVPLVNFDDEKDALIYLEDLYMPQRP